MSKEIKVPATAEELKDLKAGDMVLLSGIVYTARDQAHKRIVECIEKGEKVPFNLENSAIYYVGPTPEKDGQVIGSAGPTTSGRMDMFSPLLMEKGNTIMIGKGKRNAAVKKAIQNTGAVYLSAIGGAGAYLADCVLSSTVIAWEDLGCEAVRELTVKNMPLIVAIDSQGNDIYEIGPKEYLKG